MRMMRTREVANRSDVCISICLVENDDTMKRKAKNEGIKVRREEGWHKLVLFIIQHTSSIQQSRTVHTTAAVSAYAYCCCMNTFDEVYHSLSPLSLHLSQKRGNEICFSVRPTIRYTFKSFTFSFSQPSFFPQTTTSLVGFK